MLDDDTIYKAVVQQGAKDIMDEVIHMIEDKSGVPFDRLLELAKADKEGRIVVKEEPPNGTGT